MNARTYTYNRDITIWNAILIYVALIESKRLPTKILKIPSRRQKGEEEQKVLFKMHGTFNSICLHTHNICVTCIGKWLSTKRHVAEDVCCFTMHRTRTHSALCPLSMLYWISEMFILTHTNANSRFHKVSNPSSSLFLCSFPYISISNWHNYDLKMSIKGI